VGAFGGKEEALWKMVIHKNCKGWHLQTEKQLGPDGSVSILTPGEGGYGNSREQDQALVLHDLKEGKVSLDQALSEYGFDQK
jgi:N-methylhydantoinase B/oxoprolinase/acetone carboxylase alpha subunit